MKIRTRFAFELSLFCEQCSATSPPVFWTPTDADGTDIPPDSKMKMMVAAVRAGWDYVEGPGSRPENVCAHFYCKKCAFEFVGNSAADSSNKKNTE